MKLPIANNSTIVRHLTQLARLFGRDITVVLLIQLCVAVASIVTPWIIGRSFDALNEPDPARAIRFNIVVLIVAVSVQSVLAGFGSTFRALSASVSSTSCVSIWSTPSPTYRFRRWSQPVPAIY